MSVISKTQTVISIIKPPKGSTLTQFFNQDCFELLSNIQFAFNVEGVTIFNSTHGIGGEITYDEFKELLNYIQLH